MATETPPQTREQALATIQANLEAKGISNTTHAAGRESLARSRNAKEPIRFVDSSQTDELKSGRVMIVRDQKTGREYALKTPARAQQTSDFVDVEDLPPELSWVRWIVRREGNIVAWPMTCSSADLPAPPGARHETNAMAIAQDNFLYAGGAISLHACLDAQIAMRKLDPGWLMTRELVTPSCDTSCCKGHGPHVDLFSGEPRCPKTKIERDARLAFEAKRQHASQAQITDAMNAQSLEVAKSQADIMINAMKMLRADERAERAAELAADKPKKGKE